MADRTSAKIFGEVFTMLARNPSEENRKMAQELFARTYKYDFSTDQMNADTALKILEIDTGEDEEEDDEL